MVSNSVEIQLTISSSEISEVLDAATATGALAAAVHAFRGTEEILGVDLRPMIKAIDEVAEKLAKRVSDVTKLDL